jgi:hydrogenase maturation protease
MDLPSVFATVRALGGTLPRVLIVGCEPGELGEGIGLSARVEQAIEPCLRLVHELVARELEPEPTTMKEVES